MIQFFAPDIESTGVLPESESQHCVKVLRSRMGDTVEVIDGRGHRFSCTLIDPHPRHAAVEIVSRLDIPKAWRGEITLAVAPTKSMDRMEWMVEKLVEIGVDRIIPLKCRFSERREIKRERLEKIAVSAMKQSLKAILPIVDEMTPIEKAISASAGIDSRFIAYCSPEIPRKLLCKEYKPGADTIIFIGPEGDFSDSEIRASLDAGFVPITLGDNRLRTETAAVVACDTCHIIQEYIS